MMLSDCLGAAVANRRSTADSFAIILQRVTTSSNRRMLSSRPVSDVWSCLQAPLPEHVLHMVERPAALVQPTPAWCRRSWKCRSTRAARGTPPRGDHAARAAAPARRAARGAHGSPQRPRGDKCRGRRAPQRTRGSCRARPARAAQPRDTSSPDRCSTDGRSHSSTQLRPAPM